MAHKIYENFVLENKMDDLLTTAIDMNEFMTADYSLTENAGMKKIINTYTAKGNVEDLEMGEGNTQDIEVSFTSAEYKVGTTQGRTYYYDEQEMTDPYAIDRALKGLVEQMTNDLTAKAIDEFKKATMIEYGATWTFDNVVDAIAKVREVIKTDDIEKIKSEVEAMNKLYEPLASKLYQSAGGTVGPDGKPQFTQEQMDAFMKDPKFQEMFGGMNGNQFTGTTNNTTDTKTSNDSEFVDIEQN